MDRKKAVLLALFVVSLGFLYKGALLKLVRDWEADPNYSHGFLVVPLAIWVVWRQRDRLAAMPARPTAWGALLIGVSLLMLAAGTIGVELFLTRISLLGTLAGTILFVWGSRHLRATGFAFLLLALAIPIPAIIFNQIAFPLQLLASRFGEVAIATCGIPVLREGNVITLATTSLEVAEACSGIRSLVSLLTLAVVWGYLTSSPMWLRWTLAAAAVPIAIFANGSRVAGTGIASHFVGPAAAEGFLHTFSGWMVFVVAGVLLFLVYQLAIWLVPAARSASGGGGAPVERLDPAPATPGARAGLDWRLLAVTGCLVVTGVALGTVTRTEATALREPLSTLPASAGGWELIQDSPLDDKVLAVLAVDEYVNRAYKAPGRPWVSLYVGYYKSQRQGQTMHSPLNCMPGAGWEPVERARVAVPAQAGAASPHAGAEINRLVIQKGVDRQLVLYWYQAHGRIVASEYWGKIYTVVDAIRMNRSDGSMVRVIVPLPSQDLSAEAAAEQAALDFVRAILPDLSKRLDR